MDARQTVTELRRIVDAIEHGCITRTVLVSKLESIITDIIDHGDIGGENGTI